MREIKFRAWDAENKWMNYATLDELRKWFGSEYGFPYEVQYFAEGEKPIMQYTNVKDANGIDVYEDDIIEWEVRDGQKVRTQIRIFGIFTIGQFLTGWRKDPPTKHFEVIGNIYQNPELIK